MGVSRILALLMSGFFGLYCLTWSIIAASAPPQQRGGAAFIGVLLLLLAFVYARVVKESVSLS